MGKGSTGGGSAPEVGGGSVARNASTSYLYRLIYGVVVLILTPYLFRRLGVAGFGTYSVMFAIATVFDGVQASYYTGNAKIVAELRGAGRRREMLEGLATATAIAAVLGVAVFVLSVAVAFLGSGLSPAAHLHGFQVGMIVLGAVTLVRLMCSGYAAALLGYQRYDFFNAARVIAAVWLAAATVAAVEAGGNLEGAALALASSLLVEAILFALLMRRMDPSLPLRHHLGDRAARRRIAVFSSYLLLADAAASVSRLQPVVVAAVRNAATAAPFSAAVKLQTALQSAVYPFVDLLIPMVSELQSQGRAEEVIRRLSLATRAALQIALPLAAGIALFSEDIVTLWLGADAPAVTGEVIVILMAAQVTALTATPASKVLVGLGKVRVTAVMIGIEGILNLGLTIVLVAHYGAIGAAIPVLVTTSLLTPVLVRLACLAAGVTVGRFGRESIGPALASSMPGLAAMVAVFAVLDESTERLVLGLSLGIGLSLAVAVAQVGPGRLRHILRELIGRRRRPVGKPA